MRISSPSQYRTMLADLTRQVSAQYEIEKQVLTGKTCTTPSEADGNASVILTSKVDLAQIEQYTTNLEAANSWLVNSESAMDNIVTVINKALVVAEEMSTGTMDTLEYQAAAMEVQNLIEQIITLANSNISGVYLFGGTDTGDTPITEELAAAGPSTLVSEGGTGSDTTAELVDNPVSSGDVALQLGRASSGLSAKITISTDNTLGETGIAPPLSFDGGTANWVKTHYASDDLDQSDVWTLRYGFNSGSDEVSARVGETFSWTADTDAGEQTFHSYARVSFSGAGTGTITIDGTAYSGDDADEMIESINAAGADYFAYKDGDDVVVMAKAGSPAGTVYDVQAAGGPVDVSYATLDELTDQINDGNAAQGMLYIDDASLPTMDDTVTIGEHSWTWQEITGGTEPTDAQGFADALGSWVGQHSDDFTASATSSTAGGACVLVTANAAGSAGNVNLSASGGVLSSGSLMGGIDPTVYETDGRIYASGTSDYSLETTLTCEVMDVTAGNVSVRVRWYDDDGTRHTEDVVFSEAGEDNGKALSGLDGITLYRDDLNFEEGAVMTIELGHYQGNDEDISVSFSSGIQMTYNWNAGELLGGALTADLLGETAVAVSTSGTGALHLDGAYRGVYTQGFDMQVVDGGQVPGDEVTVQVSWTDASGNTHSENVTFTGTGSDNAQTVDGAYGLELYLDSGTYVEGDSFTYTVEKDDLQVLDTLTQWQQAMEGNDQEAAQTASQEALDALNSMLEQVLDYIADSGTKQNRISARLASLEDQTLTNEDTLDELENVDTTQALLDLTQVQAAYTANLKVTAAMGDLSLMDYI